MAKLERKAVFTLTRDHPAARTDMLFEAATDLSMLDLARMADTLLRIVVDNIGTSGDLRTRAGNARLALGVAEKAGQIKTQIAGTLTEKEPV